MEEIVHCPACGTKVGLGKEFCTACGGAMSPTSRASQAAPEVPKPAVDSAAPAHVPPPAANVNNADESWVKRHKGLSIILAIAVIGGGISIISSLSNSDSPSAGTTSDGVVAVVSCSPETLQSLTDEWVDLGNRSQSALGAIIDEVLTPTVGAKRLKTRGAREAAKEQQIQRECVTVSDSTAGAELLVAINKLETSSSVLYAYFEAFLEADFGTKKGVKQRGATVSRGIKRFNAAWAAFGEEQGFEIDHTPDEPIDESKAAD